MANSKGTSKSTKHDDSRRSHGVISTDVVPYYAGPSRSDSTPLATNTNVGTPETPIWISDDDLDEDSNVAVRGTRSAEQQQKTTSSPAPPKPTSSKKQNSSSNSVTIKAPRRNPRPETSSKPQSSTSMGSQQSVSSRSSKPASIYGRKQLLETGVHIDITALDEELEDPALEKELEEIALTGRGGLISGTPAAHDLEKGAKKPPSTSESKPPSARTTQTFVEDEADKSWHGPLPSREVSNRKDQLRRRGLYAVILLGILGALGVVLYNMVFRDSGSTDVDTTFSPPDDDPSDELTDRQQALHNVIAKITGPNILENPDSPQYYARRWLLFQDSEDLGADESRVIQRYALASFYFSTGGESWADNQWLKGHECGDEPWGGLGCDSSNYVRTVFLDNGGLSGTIPPEIGHLSRLENLILKNNPDLHGWVPTTLGHLKALQQLGLYNNNLSGVIPDIFEHASMLKFINLERNNLHGSIPLAIANLSNLQTLALSNNELEGVVPIDQLARTSVQYLGLSHNRFSSMIERSIKDIETLEYLYLDNNQIRGRIPETIGELKHMKSIDLGNNLLMGTVPSELGQLTRLEFVSLNNNELVGSIPRQIGLLTNLRTLNLSSNQLNGSIPNISNMIHLVNLHLFENAFTGTIPEAILQLQSLEVLFLSSNKLSGPIPSGIRRLSRTLRGLYLSDNQFIGDIPEDLCTFGALEALFLDANQLTGSIPHCFGDLVELKQLYLFQNQLTGTVPTSLQELRKLTGLGLESNNLVGEVPDEVCGLVDNFSLDIWADCTDQFGSEPLLCSCCSVCCPGDQCI